MIIPYTGELIDLAIAFMKTCIAPVFNSETTYSKEDVILYDGILYSCKEDISPGNWDPTDWNQVKLFDENGYFIFDGDNILI